MDAQPLQRVDLERPVRNAAGEILDAATGKGRIWGWKRSRCTSLAAGWLLRELMSNLVDNAIKYTPLAGVVTMRCGSGWCLGALRVYLEGKTTARRARERALSRYAAMHCVPGAVGEGTGLGLAIADTISRVHVQRSRWIRERKREACCVTVLFPVIVTQPECGCGVPSGRGAARSLAVKGCVWQTICKPTGERVCENHLHTGFTPRRALEGAWVSGILPCYRSHSTSPGPVYLACGSSRCCLRMPDTSSLIEPADSVDAEEAPAARKRPEQRQACRSCKRWRGHVEQPGAERITTAALAARSSVSGAALTATSPARRRCSKGS